MKVLINDRLDDHHVAQIRAAFGDIDLIIPASQGDALAVMPEIDIIFGGMSRDMFKRAERLKWVQTWGAGVDGMMYPEFVHSEVILTSAKGTVGVHLSEHAMALLLGLTRGIARAIRTSDWNERMPIRHASWELIDKTMGIVGLGGTGQDVAVRAHAFGMKIIASRSRRGRRARLRIGLLAHGSLLRSVIRIRCRGGLLPVDKRNARAFQSHGFCQDAGARAFDQCHAGQNHG